MRTAPSAPLPAVPAADARRGGRGLGTHLARARRGGARGQRGTAHRRAVRRTRWRGSRVAASTSPSTPGCTSSASLVPPRPVPGALVAATEDDVALAAEWFAAFMGDADEQAGRPRGASAHEVPDRSDLLRKIRAGWPVVLGRRVGRTGAPHRRERTRRSGWLAPGSGVHTAGPTRSRLGQQCCRRGVAPDPGPREPGLPVHRPGEPDLEQDLRGPRLPARRRHGQPCHRPLTSVPPSLGSSSRGGPDERRSDW